jgi:hypothetical protein
MVVQSNVRTAVVRMTLTQSPAPIRGREALDGESRQ